MNLDEYDYEDSFIDDSAQEDNEEESPAASEEEDVVQDVGEEVAEEASEEDVVIPKTRASSKRAKSKVVSVSFIGVIVSPVVTCFLHFSPASEEESEEVPLAQQRKKL